MRCRTLVLYIAASYPLASIAQSSGAYECTMSGLTRRVEVVHETDAPVPCQVRYQKVDEAPGARQVLWSASNEAGYCETHAQNFVERLEGFGWQCSAEAVGSSPAETEPAESRAAAESAAGAPAAQEPATDDTDVLLPPK